MTTIINLYGGPGTGKSVAAADVFVAAKKGGINAELVSEYVKQWAWEGRVPVNYDQFHFFGEQARREYSLFGKVELIVTDSPVALCGYFASVFGSVSQARCFRQMVLEYYSMVQDSGVKCHHVFLERVSAYDPRGRFQTEQEAFAMDPEQLVYLQNLGFNLATLRASDGSTDSILKLLEGE